MYTSGVYKITNPSGEIYIGQSSNVKRRMIEHLYRSKHLSTKLCKSIQKYGIDSHIVEMLFLSDVKKEKNRIEQFYINYYDSINKGLNHIDVKGPIQSFSGKTHSKKEIERIKKRMCGVTPEWAISKIRKRVFCGFNNTTYNSISECAKDLNISQPYLSTMVSGHKDNKYNVVII